MLILARAAGEAGAEGEGGEERALRVGGEEEEGEAVGEGRGGSLAAALPSPCTPRRVPAWPLLCCHRYYICLLLPLPLALSAAAACCRRTASSATPSTCCSCITRPRGLCCCLARRGHFCAPRWPGLGADGRARPREGAAWRSWRWRRHGRAEERRAVWIRVGTQRVEVSSASG